LSTRARPLALAAALAGALVASRASAEILVYTPPPDATPPRDVSLGNYGWIQPRFQAQQSDDRPVIDLQPNPAFLVERARVGAVGYLGTWGKAGFEMELAKPQVTTMDAYVVATPVDLPIASVSLTAGQFRVPFSRQNLLPSNSFQLPDVAYFVAPNFLVDRDLGAMLSGDLFWRRAHWSVAMFNGNDNGRGQTINSDPYFLFAARLELAPLGPVPRFEGDLRPLNDQHKPLVQVAGSAMRSHFDDKHVERTYLGGDLAAYWEGASVYGEIFYHVDVPLFTTGPNATSEIKQLGWNIQGGWFPRLPWVREHIELVGRVERFDPDEEVTKPDNDEDARELTGANPTWGYMGFLMGANFFWLYGHDLKLQGSYEVRNETKGCLANQTGAQCTGYIANNLFVLQITGGF
jgi:hypothetical protein